MGPKVSVVISTYNQEDLIGQAVGSAIEQAVDFELEILVGDDCSTDSTRLIVEELAGRHPETIKLLKADSNMGSQRNFTRLINACSGEYVALLDGDDFWTGTDKLAKQVAYMEANPGCAISYHNVSFLHDDPSVVPAAYKTPYPGVSSIDDLLLGNYIHSCSVMYRRSFLPRLPDWFADAGFGDYPLLILVAKNGWIGHLDEVLGTYRVHAGSSWALRDYAERVQITADVMESVAAELSVSQQQQLACGSAAMLCNAAAQLEARGESDRARTFLQRADRLLDDAGIGHPHEQSS